MMGYPIPLGADPLGADTPLGADIPLEADTPPGADTPPQEQTPAYGQRAAGTHPTGMHSCFVCIHCLPVVVLPLLECQPKSHRPISLLESVTNL